MPGAATPDELARLERGLESMRAAESQQEARKRAWLQVIEEACERGDDIACEDVGFNEDALKQAWLDSRRGMGGGGAAPQQQQQGMGGGFGGRPDPALPPNTPYLDTFADRGKGPVAAIVRKGRVDVEGRSGEHADTSHRWPNRHQLGGRRRRVQPLMRPLRRRPT